MHKQRAFRVAFGRSRVAQLPCGFEFAVSYYTMSSNELREQILALYRQIDENVGGDVDKALTAARAALSVFQRETAFAEGDSSLVFDGYQRIRAISQHSDSKAAGHLLTEWRMLVANSRPRYR